MPGYALSNELNSLYAPCSHCGGYIHLSFNKAIEKQLLKVVQKSIKQLHEKGSYGFNDLPDYQDLIAKTYQILSGSLTSIVHEVPATLMHYLKANTFVFSSLKTHAQLYYASKMLLDESGNIKSFDKFAKDIQSIVKNYNTNYLEAEYLFATQAAQSAANWSNIANDTTLLQYRTAADERVRAAHQILHNITLPKKDKFWNEYYPPNGWRCRCHVVEVNDGVAVTDSQEAFKKGNASMTDKEAKIFKFNPGKDQIIFPPNHPYTKIPDATKVKDMIDFGKLPFEKIKKEASKVSIQEKKTIYSLPKEEQFLKIRNYKSGGAVTEHVLVNRNKDDYEYVLKSAIALARKGYKVEILPEIHKDDEIARKLLLPNYDSNKKNPDLRVNGFYVDVKSPHRYLNSINNINKAANRQESFALITDRYFEIDNKVIKTIEDKGFSDNYTKDKIFLLQKNKIVELNKKEKP